MCEEDNTLQCFQEIQTNVQKMNNTMQVYLKFELIRLYYEYVQYVVMK